jgi:hypothetical protein
MDEPPANSNQVKPELSEETTSRLYKIIYESAIASEKIPSQNHETYISKEDYFASVESQKASNNFLTTEITKLFNQTTDKNT